MKINKIIPFMFLASIALTACSMSETYIPKKGGSVSFVPHGDTSGDQPGPGESGYTSKEEEEDEKNTTIEFYFSNIYSETPIFSVEWWMLKPLGSIPEAVSTEQKVKDLGAALGYQIDPRFPKFIGFSFYSTCLDEDGLWHYETDHKQQAVTCLYGIWVSE